MHGGHVLLVLFSAEDVPFNWHIHELGMEYIYIKLATPRLNGKFEGSHLTDKQAFYQLVDDKADVNLHEKLAEWEVFYSSHRPIQHMEVNTL